MHEIQDQSGIPVLTSAFQKAWKSDALFSALLAAWDLIGFEVKVCP